MKRFITIIFSAIILMLMMIWLLSCNTYQKQLNTYRAFGVAHPDQSAILCAQLYPAKDSIGKTVIDSVHRAKNMNYLNTIDSLQAIADMLQTKNNIDTIKSNPCSVMAKSYESTISQLRTRVDALKNVYVPCKPDTVYKTQTVYRVDVAALTVEKNRNKIMNDSLVILKTQLKASQAQSTKRLHWVLILGGIIGLSILGTILKILGKI